MAPHRRAARRAPARRDEIDPTRRETPFVAAVAAAAAALDAVAPCSPPRTEKSFLAHVEHEIEPRGEAVPGLGHSHQELAAKEAIAPVHRLVRKIELGREQALLRRLHLDVVVAGAAGVERRQDGAEAVAALHIGEHVSAIAKAGIVVFAALVGVPQVDERLRHRPAGAAEDLAIELDQPRLAGGVDEIGTLRRTRLEKRALGLADGRRIAVVALRRRLKRLRQSIVEHKVGRTERACGEKSAACGMKRHRGLQMPPFNLISAVLRGATARARVQATRRPLLHRSLPTALRPSEASRNLENEPPFRSNFSTPTDAERAETWSR